MSVFIKIGSSKLTDTYTLAVRTLTQKIPSKQRVRIKKRPKFFDQHPQLLNELLHAIVHWHC